MTYPNFEDDMKNFVSDAHNFLEEAFTLTVIRPVESYLKQLELIKTGIKLMRQTNNGDEAITIGTYLKALNTPDRVLLSLIEELLFKGVVFHFPEEVEPDV